MDQTISYPRKSAFIRVIRVLLNVDIDQGRHPPAQRQLFGYIVEGDAHAVGDVAEGDFRHAANVDHRAAQRLARQCVEGHLDRRFRIQDMR